MGDVSIKGQKILKFTLDDVCRSLHSHYLKLDGNELNKSERFGNIIYFYAKYG